LLFTRAAWISTNKIDAPIAMEGRCKGTTHFYKTSLAIASGHTMLPMLVLMHRYQQMQGETIDKTWHTKIHNDDLQFKDKSLPDGKEFLGDRALRKATFSHLLLSGQPRYDTLSTRRQQSEKNVSNS